MTTAIQLPRKHEWQEIQPDHGVFVVEPFEPGFALTVGNAFRRVLLSSIEGAAFATRAGSTTRGSRSG